VVAALTQPTTEPDKWRWSQWITELRDKINAECKELGIDPKALLRTLDQRQRQFMDPMTQNNIFQPPGEATANPFPWPAALTPPHAERALGPFADTDNGRKFAQFAQFSGTERGQQLRKFYDYGRAAPGADVRKGEDGSPAELEAYAKVVVRSELDRGLQKQVLAFHDARKRAGPAAWRKVKREPMFRALRRAIVDHRGLTETMKGACLTLSGSATT
jgi:hypothetical protein